VDTWGTRGVLGRLGEPELELLARRVAELVGPRPTDRLIDVREAAALLGVSRDYIYAHAEELGVIRVGSGRRARLRFDPGVLRTTPTPLPEAASAGGRRRPRRQATTNDGIPLLRIRDAATPKPREAGSRHVG